MKKFQVKLAFTSRAQFAIIREKIYRVVNPLEHYLNQLLQLKNNFSVKIISGLDSSVLLKNFAEALQAEGVASEEIIFVDCAAEVQLKNFDQLYNLVVERTAELEKFFLLVNEIERVADWEKTINALFVSEPAEIYVAGSSYSLAEKISALLLENCDVLKIYPPSFAEYAKNFPEEEADITLQMYLHYGSLPVTISADEEFLPTILRDFIHETLSKIEKRNSLYDVKHLWETMSIFADNVGIATSFNHLSSLVMQQVYISNFKTIMNYLRSGKDLFVKIPRLDIKLGKTAAVPYKFYCIDNGLLFMLTNLNYIYEAKLIENAVCIELLRRGYKVSFGRFGSMDVTFVAERGDKKIYLQVLPTDGSITLKRITRPLLTIEGGEKFLISMNHEKISDGVQNLTVQEFLSGA